MIAWLLLEILGAEKKKSPNGYNSAQADSEHLLFGGECGKAFTEKSVA